jgi:hypothetical protein
MIRAIALGLFDVDPVTRRVGPHRTVSAGRVSSTSPACSCCEAHHAREP